MAHNKFEKHIKRQLAQREIAPSQKAWDRVAEQLDSPGKSGSKKVLWYGIAASFTAILLGSLVFFNAMKQSPGPVVAPVNVVEGDMDPKMKDLNVREKTVLQKVPDKADVENTVARKLEKTSLDIEKTPALDKEKKSSSHETLVTHRDIELKEKIVETLPSEATEVLIASKVNELVAQVELLEQRNAQEISDMEIDSLLRMAQRELMEEKLFKEDGKVDAMALLTNVEDELDQSFRDQIFEKLKTGFLKVRTAVADRNN